MNTLKFFLDVTHVKLKNVFRGHIANERNLQNPFNGKCPTGSKCGSLNPGTESCGIIKKRSISSDSWGKV